jgi:hypothetical protein
MIIKADLIISIWDRVALGQWEPAIVYDYYNDTWVQSFAPSIRNDGKPQVHYHIGKLDITKCKSGLWNEDIGIASKDKLGMIIWWEPKSLVYTEFFESKKDKLILAEDDFMTKHNIKLVIQFENKYSYYRWKSYGTPDSVEDWKLLKYRSYDHMLGFIGMPAEYSTDLPNAVWKEKYEAFKILDKNILSVSPEESMELFEILRKPIFLLLQSKS